MKRSYVNELIRKTEAALSENKIALPEFSRFGLKEWEACRSRMGTVKKTMLGWDITDYGRGEFEKLGTVLFTIRNGDQSDASVGTPYAEKLLFVLDGQRLPLHCHRNKTEDIINRGGGDMFMILYGSDANGGVDRESDVTLYCDGMPKTVKAGERFIVTRGNSVTLTPGIYHIFGAEAGRGDLIAWEVSSINDDNTDNYFAEEVSRFAGIEEDEPPLRILCNEYEAFLPE